MKFTFPSFIFAAFVFTFSVVSSSAVPNTERDDAADFASHSDLLKDLESKGTLNENRRSEFFSLDFEDLVVKSIASDIINVAGNTAPSAPSVEEKRQDGASGNDEPFGFQCEPGVLNGCFYGAAEKRASSGTLEIVNTDLLTAASIEEKRQDGAPGNPGPFFFQCEPGVLNGCTNEAGAADIPNRFVLVLVSGLVAIGGWLHKH